MPHNNNDIKLHSFTNTSNMMRIYESFKHIVPDSERLPYLCKIPHKLTEFHCSKSHNK